MDQILRCEHSVELPYGECVFKTWDKDDDDDDDDDDLLAGKNLSQLNENCL